MAKLFAFTAHRLGQVGFSEESLQFFERTITPPTDARAAIYADLVIDPLVAAGVWPKLDVVCCYAGAIIETAFLNLKSSSFTSGIGSLYGGGGSFPEFTPDLGFGQAGLENILTWFNPTLGSYNFTQNSAMICGYYQDEAQSNSLLFGTEPAGIELWPRHSSNRTFFRLNSSSRDILDPYSGPMGGFWMLNRTASNAVALLRNNVELMATSTPSQAMTNSMIASVVGLPVCSFFAAGASLNSAERLALYTAATDYIAAVTA